MANKIVQIFNSFSKKERLIFIAAFFVFSISSILWIARFISAETKLVPVDNGKFTEGDLGQPIFINPLYASNNPIDNDISRLVFSNLKTISEKIQKENDNKTFNIRIKENALWHDNAPITSDDIIFTIKSIQDPDSNSPLASNFKGVATQRISEREVSLTIPEKYVFFQDILANLQPIPKHLFENIPLPNIKLSTYNLEPIGSGPFKFSGFEKQRDGFITAISLKRNEKFFGAKPHLDTINFKFYRKEEDLIKSFNSGDIDAFSLSSQKNLSKISIPSKLFGFEIPRYYAIFFNKNSNPLLTDPQIRKALNLATDKQALAYGIFGDNATPLNSPITNQDLPLFANNFSIENANSILENNGWKLNDKGIREKETKNGPSYLTFVLAVYPSPFLMDTANTLKEQWSKAGIKLEIYQAQPANFKDSILKPRNYEMLLFGNIYSNVIDPYSFWHSSQSFYPGLNLSLYNNTVVDNLIENIRFEFNPDKKLELTNTLSQTIAGDNPAIFLYSPKYLYISNKLLKGFEQNRINTPSYRFSNIENWYTKTIRVLK